MTEGESRHEEAVEEDPSGPASVEPGTASSGDGGEGSPAAEAADEAGADAGTPEAQEERAAELEEEAELERLQGELEAVNERHLRLAAEFENYRKRVERERSQAWARAQSDLVHRLLDALDDLDRVAGTDGDGASVESVLEGVRLVNRKLRKALEDAGMETLEPLDEEFDPETMEALMTVPAEEDSEDDTVAEVYQKGYLFQGHLVRPARVVVRKVEG